jgi:hypothetical protein
MRQMRRARCDRLRGPLDLGDRAAGEKILRIDSDAAEIVHTRGNHYILHRDAVIVVVDGYESMPGDEVRLQEREVVVRVLQVLEFAPEVWGTSKGRTREAGLRWAHLWMRYWGKPPNL